MLFHEQPSEPWTELDFLLVEAMEILDEETCKECGNPIWVCRNEFATHVGFKIKTATCFAKAELDKWNEAQQKKNKSLDAGQYPYIVPYTYDESEMPSRMHFYKELSEKHKVE